MALHSDIHASHLARLTFDERQEYGDLITASVLDWTTDEEEEDRLHELEVKMGVFG